MPKTWHLKPKYPADFAENLPGFSNIILQLLYDRGLDNHAKVDEFLNPDYTQDVHDPFLFNQMQLAVDRIKQAMANQEKILVYGDYDADGVTASTVLAKSLKKIGIANVEVFIPHRETDGYGLSLKKTSDIINQKFNLVITVDNGITAIEPIKVLTQAGIDTIITDHHLPADELPTATAILNCSLAQEKYPFKKLAGVGMAFKLVQALLQNIQPTDKSESLEAFEKWLLDLVTIGTIGDVSPILGENRTLIKYGLMVLNKTSRPGLRELIHTCSLSNGHDPNNPAPLGKDLYNLTVRNVAWQIVPRLNAAGRVDHANLAYELLTTEDEIEAIALARDVHAKNLERQKIADKTITEAKEIFSQVKSDDKILITANQNWLPGIVGLVAGKLKDEFYRPVILFAQTGEKYSGSGRSIPELNIVDVLRECDELLERFGGHSQACGLTIHGKKNYQQFIAKATQIINKKLQDVDLTPSLAIDVEVKLADLNWELWDQLEKFEPFAEANPLPLFLIRRVKLDNLEIVGKTQEHLRFYFSQASQQQKAISFGTAKKWKDDLVVGEIVDIVVEFGVNEWNGNRELQLKVVDIRVNSLS